MNSCRKWMTQTTGKQLADNMYELLIKCQVKMAVLFLCLWL